MRILCWTCGSIKWDMIRNDNIKESWCNTYNKKFVENNKFRWFEHIEEKTYRLFSGIVDWWRIVKSLKTKKDIEKLLKKI